MKDGPARLTVTSPPYGVGMEYEEKGIEPWRKTISGVINAIADHTLIIVWNIGDLYATDGQFIEPTSMYSTEYMDKCGFGMLYARIWKKPGANFAGVNPYHLVSMKPVQEYEWILGYARRDYYKAFEKVQSRLKAEAEKASLDNYILKKITGAGFMYGHWFTMHQFAMIDEDNYTKIQKYCRKNNIDAFKTPYPEIRREFDNLNVYQKTLTDAERSEWGQWAIWEINTVSTRDGHPAAYPVELPARAIKMHTREGDTVLDPFGGSGTTLVACEQLGRICRTIEREPHYCDVIIQRWENLTGKKAERVTE
jgi:DNA modification methylase